MKKQRLIVNKNNRNFTDPVRVTYHTIRQSFGYNARISQLIEMIRVALGIEEFEAYDPNVIENAKLESYMMDKQIQFMAGEDVDFSEIYESIIKAGNFLTSEKRLFEQENIEERLWGIMLAITDPENENNL